MAKNLFTLICTLTLAAATVPYAHAEDGLFGGLEKAGNDAAKDTQKALDDDSALDPGKKILIEGNGQTVTRDCAGLDVKVSGNQMKVTLTGECKSVDISGNGNTVDLNTAKKIAVSGTENNVLWTTALKGAAPKVAISGVKNTVTKKEPKK